MAALELEIFAFVKRAAEALERIADADERRNELLVADAAKREQAWRDDVELRRAALGAALGEQLDRIKEDPDGR